MATKKKSSRAKTNRSTTKKSPAKTSAKTSASAASKRSTKAASAKQATAKADKSVSNLSKWNIAAAVILAAQAITLLIISKAVSLPVNVHFLTKDELASQTAGHTVVVQAVRHLFDVRLSWLIAAFMLVAAVMYIVVSTIARKQYETAVKNKASSWRWGSNAVSVGLLFATLLLVNGMYDFVSLIMLLTLVAAIQLFGYISEVLAAKNSRAKWPAFTAMFVTGAIVWLTIALYVKSALMYGSGLPHFVYWLDASVAGTAVLLAANKYLVVRAKGKWADYVYGERWFTVLLVVAMSAVAWQLYFGSLR